MRWKIENDFSPTFNEPQAHELFVKDSLASDLECQHVAKISVEINCEKLMIHAIGIS